VSLFFMNAFIFITFFAPTVEVLCAGQVLCGTRFQSYCRGIY
jgi:SP family general alpha glucoside:H+ symporter-like MFS transporter